MNDKIIKELHFALFFGRIIIYLYGFGYRKYNNFDWSIVPIFMGYIPLELSILKKGM